MITQAQLKELLHYDPKTGLFKWIKITSNRIKVGSVAGFEREDGYIQIRINGVLYYGHVLAWLYMTGEWPDEIDHEDLKPSNNKFINLRKGTRSQNKGNVRKYSNNKSGYKGVSWAKANNKWVVYIKVETMRKNLGYYDNLLEAAKVYEDAASKYFKEFARTI